MAMEWTDTPQSSQIVRIGYDAETLEARVEFRDRRSGDVQSTYSYQAVPKEVVDGILSAESVGRAFASSLKYGYSYRRI